MNDSLDSLPIHTLRIQDHEVCFRDIGRGPIVILLHGWSLNSTYWAPQIEFLSKNYRVIAYDWRGMGCSGGGQEAFEFEALCDEARAVIGALCGDQRPTLIGHSLGGNIILRLASESSEELSGVVVVDAPLPHRVQEESLLMTFRLASERMSLKLMSTFAQRALWGERFAQLEPEIVSYWKAQFCSNSVPALINSLAAWARRPNPMADLDKIKIRSALIVGEDDMVAGNDMRELQQAWSGAQLHVIKNAGHMSFVEQPDQFNEVIGSFLDSLSTS
jgi:pimeloyl-ACP methyl ester carboxylesterase